MLDNSDYLAVQTFPRHQVPPSGYPAWDQYRDENGKSIYPQRPILMGSIEPVPSTNYEIHEAQVVVPGTAAERGGIQPVVTLLSDQTERPEIFLQWYEIRRGCGWW